MPEVFIWYEPKYMNRTIIMTFDYKKQNNILAAKVLYMAEGIVEIIF